MLGLDPATAGDRLRRRIGAQLQDAALPDKLRVGEALRLFASLHASPRPLGELAEEWDLGRLWSRPFGALSGGERQRLFVALALVGRPELVFLDELTQNLDPVGRRHTWDVIRRVRDGGTTVVLVTHDVEEAERLCDRIVVMAAAGLSPTARRRRSSTSSAGRRRCGSPTPTSTCARCTPCPGVTRVQRHGPEVHVAGSGPLLAFVGAHLVDIGRPAIDLHVHRPSLEDQFVKLTHTAPHEKTSPHDHRRTRRNSTRRSDDHDHRPPVDTGRRQDGLVRTIVRLTGVELRLLLREPGVLVSLIAFPAVTVLVLAGVFGSDPDPDFGGVIPSEHYVVGYVGVVLASLGLVTLPAHLASHRELGVLRRYRAAGLDARAVVGSHIALGAVLGTVASAVVLVDRWPRLRRPDPGRSGRASSPGSSPDCCASSPSAAPSAR